MSAGHGQSGGAEQRRFARVPINLDGYLAVAGHAPVPCTARDFCLGGMFISADPAAYANAAVDAPATLYFALMVGGEKQDYQLALRVARVVAKGIGVSFADADDATLRLLGQLAAPPGLPESSTPGGGSPAVEEFAPEFAAVVEPLCEVVAGQVAALVGHFIDRVDEKLFMRARDAGNNVDETRFLDGQRELRGRQAALRDDVAPRIDDGVRNLRNTLSAQDRDPQSIGLSDLSLIEKDEFEEFLVISEMVSELEPEFGEALFQLTRRFSFLANRDIDTSGLPIGPGALCNAVAESLKGLQSDRRVTMVVFRILHEVMSARLGGFYEAVNALLIEHGVLPVIERGKPAIRRRPPSNVGFDATGRGDTAPAPAAEEDLSDLMPAPDAYHGRGAVTPTAPSGGAQAAPPGVPPGGVQAAPPGVPPGVVQAAPPSLPPGGVQAASPSLPPGGVQAAPPSLPPGGVQAAPPSPPPGGVQAAPPGVPSGVVQAAPPSLPPGGVHAATPNLPAGPWTGEGGAQDGSLHDTGASGHAMSYAGWTRGPVGTGAVNIGRAYSAAQTQLALRRQLLPQAVNGGEAASHEVYSNTQLARGLAELQREFSAGEGEPLAVDDIRERIRAALEAAGIPQRELDANASDAMEVVAGLFGSLLEDAMVARGARQHLTRLQPAVHRAAVQDSQFFADDEHPVRRVLERLARLRDGKSEGQQARHQRVRALVGRANDEFEEDFGLFDDFAAELDDILRQQEVEYREQVADVVESCERQQQVLEERRGESQEATEGGAERSDWPEEWHKWLERSRQLEVGQRMLMNATSANPALVTLVWRDARGNRFVFVDEQGNKANSLTLQQVAMYLRRGILRTLDADDAGNAVGRAMLGVVGRFHRDVEAQATRDDLTGFLHRRFFAEAIDAELPDVETAAARNVAVAEIELTNLRALNEAHGAAVGDTLLKAFAGELARRVRGKDVVFGRLDGAVLGVYWPNGGVQGAYKKLQAAVEPLRALGVPLLGADFDPDATLEVAGAALDAGSGSAARAEFSIGLTSSEDALVDAAGLLAAAREACETAIEMGSGAIYVTGSENEQRRRIEALVELAERALEEQTLVLSGQHVTSLASDDSLPGLHVAVGLRRADGSNVAAAEFAPALARSARAAEIDLWAFRRTLAWMQAHEDELEAYALVMIPLSSASVRNEDLAGLLMAEFMETPVPPGRICFGMPDHEVVENVTGASELIGTLREFGCRFMLDEFGSGHDNYDYIKSVDVDFVSVRSGFISDARGNPKDFAMAKSINELVHFMGKKTVAKQLPGADLGDTMREIGIDFLYDQSERVVMSGGPA
jgi:diguanylate cyclase (GGDEF)-like protein